MACLNATDCWRHLDDMPDELREATPRSLWLLCPRPRTAGTLACVLSGFSVDCGGRGGPCLSPLQMYWCLAMRSGVNLRPQRAHGTLPSGSAGWMDIGARLRWAETPAADTALDPPWQLWHLFWLFVPTEDPKRCLAARHWDMCWLSSNCGISMPHAGHGTIIIACFFAHCCTWKFMLCANRARPQCGQETLGGGIAKLVRGSLPGVLGLLACGLPLGG